MFQSTRPRGARPSQARILMNALQFQSTRPRGARRGRAERIRRHHGVSIHAPARGATILANRAEYASYGFNPRAREGRDPP